MLMAFVVLAGGAFAVAVLLPPVFQSQAKIIVEAQQIPADLVRSTVTGIAAERLQVIQQRITTRDVLLELVEKFKLFGEDGRRLTPTELVELMRASIAIEQFDLGNDRQSRASSVTIGFTVGFEHRSPEVAARVANELVTLILAEDVKSRTSRASETTRFIEREANRRRKELAGIEAQLAAFKLENDSVLPEKLPSLMARLERANSERAALDREIYGAQEQKRMMELELSIRQAGLGSDGAGQPRAALQQLNALNNELAMKRSVYTDSHPDVQSLRRQIAALEGQEQANLASTPVVDGEPPAASPAQLDLDTMLLREKIDASERQRARLQAQRDRVSQAVDDLNGLVSKVPEVQVYLVSLERQHESIRMNLAELDSKLNEARLGERLEQDKQAERFEVIEQPVTPTEPVKPNRPLILAGGLGLAGGLALGVAAMLEMLNRTVRSTADIVRILGQPPLATIPYIVTTSEIRRNRRRVLLGLLMIGLAIAAALLAVHVAYMPLDEAFFKVVGRFGI